MAGYCGYSKSNNAIEAECDYKYPKSTAKRLLGLKDSAFGSPCEWHHTSLWYNTTDYYDLRDLVSRQILRDHSTARPNAEQMLMRARVRRVYAAEIAGYDHRGLVKTEAASPIMAPLLTAARQYRAAKAAKAEAKVAAEAAQRQAELAAERAAAAADYDAQLRRRCACAGVTRERIAAALAGAEAENKTGIYAQIRAWFRGREDRAMEFAVC